jgi:hypothetical protein
MEQQGARYAPTYKCPKCKKYTEIVFSSGVLYMCKEGETWGDICEKAGIQPERKNKLEK